MTGRHHRRLPLAVLVPVASALVVLVALGSLASGALDLSVADVLSALGERIGVHHGNVDPIVAVTVIDIRLPRILLGLLVGAGLGVAGACLQGVFRNPVADAGIIGVSTGAAFGAVAAIVLGVEVFGRWSVAACAFSSALATTLVVYALAQRAGRVDVLALVLTGIAVNALMGAAVGVLILRADDAQLRSITFWQLGSLAAGQWSTVKVAAPVFLAGISVAPLLAHRLDVLALGDREAAHLGLDPHRIRLVLIVLAAVLAGTAVAVVGVVGFVGLVVPNVVRLLAGPAHRGVLIGSALVGAALMAAADLAARTVAAPQEVPLGVVTGAVGGLFFLVLLRARARQGPA